MLRPLRGALLSAALSTACQTAPPPIAGAPVSVESNTARRAQASKIRAGGDADGGGADAVAAEAIDRIAAGDYEEARALLDRLLLSAAMAASRAALAGGVPEDALVEIDRALELAPSDPEVRLLKADASLRLAENKIQSGGAAPGLIEGALEDALEYYRQSAESAHALFGASRAAWLLGRREEGLELARRGLGLRTADEAPLVGLGMAPERIHAEQVFAAYAGARRDSDAGATALFRESEEALARLIGRTREDPWAWSTLSDLYEWEERLSDAREACERGLLRVPEDAGLLERLARVTRGLDGSAAVVARLEAFVGEHARVAAGRWQLALARFQLALEGYKASPRVLDGAPFARAEAEFEALAGTDFADAALGYRAVCRLARGWCRFHAGDLAGAEREFLAMNELFEGGIEWSLPGELESGIQGLFFVADGHSAQGDNLAAGTVFERLRELQPDQYLWANNAGFFLRDAAFALEFEGQRLCRAARGLVGREEALDELRAGAGIARELAGTEEERGLFLRAADAAFARAQTIMERSWQAYRPAAELAPRDVRVVNDAALVLVYYLHHDLELAESLLLRCVALGGPEVEEKRAALAAEESPERAAALEGELALLTEAWGDAHQNLGVLAWVHRQDAEAARTWLEKSLEIWPERTPVRNGLLPLVRGERTLEDFDPWDLLKWAKPCGDR
jgi:tetratricopeptide (TPR) repeat protein